MIILLALTDASHALGLYDRVDRRLPHMTRIAGFQVMDPNSVVLSGTSPDEMVWTNVSGNRLFMPYRMKGRNEAFSKAQAHRRGAVIVLGSEEVYECFLPFAERVVHLVLKHPRYDDPFDGGIGHFPDLTQEPFVRSWRSTAIASHEGSYRMYPGFEQRTYETTGVPHFELKAPDDVHTERPVRPLKQVSVCT